MISKLLIIAERREQTALATLSKQKIVVQEAKSNQKKCEKELSKFQYWRPTEEDRLFQALCQQPCSAKELDHFQLNLAQLQQQENHLHNQLENAKTKLVEQEQVLADCYNHYQEASKKLEKFKELKSRQQDEARNQEITQQELEQEDRPDSLNKGLF